MRLLVPRERPGVLAAAVVLCLAGVGPAAAQTILSILGGGSDDGQAASRAALASPGGVAADRHGNLLIADADAHRIRRVDARTGLITTIAGNGAMRADGDGGPATLASIGNPTGITVDSGGDVFFSDAYPSYEPPDGPRVRRIDAASGFITTVAGGKAGKLGDGGPATAATLDRPSGVAVSADGVLYISDTGHNRVRAVSLATGVIETLAGTGGSGSTGDGGPASEASVWMPSGLALGPDGALHVAEAYGCRVRRIDLRSRTITTVAGRGAPAFDGDGGPATAAALNVPAGVGFDAAGALVVADTGNNRLRRVDPRNGTISTLAGTGTAGSGGDGGPATAAQLRGPRAVAGSGDALIVADTGNGLVRQLLGGTITLVAGSGATTYVGDGGPGSRAALSFPAQIAFRSSGELLVADGWNNRVRALDPVTGTVSTVAGTGAPGAEGDGGPATRAQLQRPYGVVVNKAGDLVVADTGNLKVRQVDATTHQIRTVAGTGAQDFSGDGGPAVEATFKRPDALALDAAGTLYVADSLNNRIRRVDAATQVITTVAGSGPRGFGGDGGAATAALLDTPTAVSVDAFGAILIADQENHRIRQVTPDGVITTIAGSGPTGSSAGGFGGDGGPATAALLKRPTSIHRDADRNLWIVDNNNNRIRRVDGVTGIITTVVGSGVEGLSGDGGPATRAALRFPVQLAFGSDGALVFSDSYNGRVRSVRPCRASVGPFDVASPPDSVSATSSVLTLSWGAARDAFGYEVLVDTEFPPRKVVAPSVGGLGLQVSGLEPGKTYYWQVRAKGDPYCPPVAFASGLRRFRTAVPCLPPAAPVLGTPTIANGAATLSWAPSEGAASYDVSLGPGDALEPLASNVTGTSAQAAGLVPGTRYRWRVVARAACNGLLSSASLAAPFDVPGPCPLPAVPAATGPADGARDLPAPVLVSWAPVAGAASYDLYLGTASEPPLAAAGLVTAAFSLPLEPGQTYRWRVVARAACGAAQASSSAVRTFATAPACVAPPAPTGPAVPSAEVPAGATYTVSWGHPDAGRGTSFVLERSADATFTSGVSAVSTASRSAVLVAGSPGTVHHRVRSVAACGLPSAPVAVPALTVGAARPNVTLVRPPRATVTRQPPSGMQLPKLDVEIRNTGDATFFGFLSPAEPVPFFLMGELPVSLRPGESRIVPLQFDGVPTDQTGAYDGTLGLLSGDPSDPAALPQAGVSLAVTSARTTDPLTQTVAPELTVGGAKVDLVRFAPTAVGAAPPDLSLDVTNRGATPVDLAADALPDPWVTLAAGWNQPPLAPGATRTVTLRCDRIRGETGGAFPRFTYLTFRTVDGKTSRLLVEDLGPLVSGPTSGRPPLAGGASSLVVPAIVNAASKSGGRYVSRLLVTNLGPEAAQADLYYTPDTGDPAASGYDPEQVLLATVVVPGHDVVALDDPLGRLFGREGSGALEVRSERIGQLRVLSVVDAPAPGGGSFGFQLPVVASGDGARFRTPHVAPGVRIDSVYRTNLILAETAGQPSSVTVTLFDRTGRPLGSEARDCPPYSKQQIALADLAGGTPVPAGAVEIVAAEGSAGSVAGVVTVIDGRTGDASSFLSRPMTATTASTLFTLASVVVSGTFRSRVEIRNDDARPVTYTLVYRGSTGTLTSVPRTLAPRAIDAFDDVLGQVFGLGPTSFGPLAVSADSPSLAVTSRVYAETASGSYGDAIDAVPLDDPSTTGAGGRLVLTDGLEGTADADRSRGARTNLILTEIAGQAADLEVAVWEKSQRRVAPVAKLRVSLAPYEQRQVNDLFGDDGLGIGSKDRLNVLCTVRPTADSQGRVIALATRIDNRTNDTKNLAFRP